MSEQPTVQSPRFISAYSPKLKTPLHFTLPSLTKQSFKDECDINVIMRRYQATGVLEHQRDATQAIYADVTAYDYQEAMNLVAQANSAFHGLPSHLRARFDNDPAKLLDFVHDPRNLDESIALGFVDAAKLQPEGVGTTAPMPEAPPAPAKAAAASTGKGEAGTAGGSAPSKGG